MRADSPCTLCGYRIRLVMVGTARVNKRSMRVSSTLGAWQYNDCPECGTPVARGSAAPVTAWVLMPGDAAKVAEYRERRFGVAA